MATMFTHLFSRRRPPKDSTGIADPRAPRRRKPDPMPRMRWYS
jgi:hypothetical protein